MLYFNPYNRHSQSVRGLKTILNNWGIRTYLNTQPRPGGVTVNWGCGDLRPAGTILNPQESINLLVDKVVFFRHAGRSKYVLPWTTDRAEAREWDSVVCRRVTRGSGGYGITILEQGQEIPNVPLYTKYIKKSHEYRVHVVKNPDSTLARVLCVQRKIFKKTPHRQEPLDWKVRSHDNGFIFAHENLESVPTSVTQTVLAFVGLKFPDLNFGGWDVIYSDKSDRAWVVEGNSAPGLEGHTLECYAEFFREVHNQR